MRYFIDTEFDEPGQLLYPTITLISIGIVAEDGRELYAVSGEARKEHCCRWVQENVWPLLGDTQPQTRAEIRDAIRQFIGDDPSPEFVGYYADYDFVVFSWLWGALVDMPRGWPCVCLDLKQDADRRGVWLSDLVPDPVGAHSALVDARWIRDAHAALAARAQP